ncbi:MAG TPA: hypothetical protein VET23_12715 [Chitinophagaceae bacterium]|nr:hypothetical protein [Chitinophagaceae bacterium]
MKKIATFLALVSILAACKPNGWSAKDKNDFISTCAQSAAAAMGQDKAKSYCTCMEQKLEVKFPNSQDANKSLNTPGFMETPEMQAMVQSCLNGGNGNINNNNNNNIGGAWTNDDEQKFMNTCVQNAMNAGADRQTSTDHCNCTLKKIEAKYHSYDEANQKMTKDEVTAFEQECIQERNNNNQ